MTNIIEKIIEKDLLVEKDNAKFSDIIQKDEETLKITDLNEEYFKKFKTFCNNIKLFNIFEMISIKKNIENEKNPNSFISTIAKLNNIFYDISNSILKLGKNTENYLKYKNISYLIYEKLTYVIHYLNIIQKLNNLTINYKDYYMDELKKVSEKENIYLKKELEETLKTVEKLKKENKKLEKLEELKRISKEIKKSNNSINTINEEHEDVAINEEQEEDEEKTNSKLKIENNNLKSLNNKITKIGKRINERELYELNNDSLNNRLKDIKNKIQAINSISNIKEITENDLINLLNNLNSSENKNVINIKKNNSKENKNLSENDQKIFKRIIKNFKNFLITKKQLLEEFIESCRNNGRFTIMEKSIDGYKEKNEELMDILRSEKTTSTKFNSAIVDLKNICVTINGKIDLKKMINVFDSMKVIYQRRNKENEYFLSHKLKNEFEKYLSETNKEMQRLVKDRNTQYQSENPQAKIKKVFLPSNIEETQEKLFDVLENMMLDIKKIVKNLQNEKNIKNIKQHLQDYKNQFYKITYILSLTPTNQLSIPQLNLAMRTIAVEEHKEDLGSIDNENLIKWFDSISIVGGLFINNNNYQSIRDKLKIFKIDLEKTFEDVKNSVINKYKQKNNLEDEDIIKAYIDFLTSQIYYFKSKLDAFNDIKDSEKSIEINKIYPNDLDIAKKNHLNELNKVNKNNLKEFKQQCYDILNNICLTNDNKFSKEIFKKILKKINLVKEKDIDSFKINEMNFNKYIDEIIKLKNYLYESIEKFKLKHKNIAEMLIGEKTFNKNKNLENKKNQRTGNESFKEDSKKLDELQKEFENLKPTNSINDEIETLEKDFESEIKEKQKIINESFIEDSKKIDNIRKEIKNLKPTNSMNDVTTLLNKKFKQIKDMENSTKSKLKEINNMIETLDKLKTKKEPQENIISKERSDKISSIKFLTNVVASELIDHPEYHTLESLNDEDLNLLNSLIEKTEIEDEKK